MGFQGDEPMSRVISQALLMSVKDTKIFFTNRFAVAFALAFPFLFILGFTLALGDVGPEDEQLVFFVASEDSGEIARDVIDGLLADEHGLRWLLTLDTNRVLALIADESVIVSLC